MEKFEAWDNKRELAEISRKFLKAHKVYRCNKIDISDMNDNRIISFCHAYCEENNLVSEFNRFKNQNLLLLSADSDISLYYVSKEILNNFDNLLDEFYKRKTESCFDETLFVEFLKDKFGDNAVSFVKIVGKAYSPNPIIEEEYKDTKWYNF